MQFQTEENGKWVCLKPLTETLGVAEVADFKSKIREVIEDGNKSFILDLESVDFVDSTGLGAIVSTIQLLKSDREYVLCNLREGVSALLKMTRLDRVVKVFPSREEAVEFINQID